MKNIAFTNTINSILLIIYALAIGVGLRDRAKALQVLSLFEKTKTEYGFDIRTDFFEKETPIDG